MRAIVLEKPGRTELREVPDPSPGPGEIVVKVSCCGICGTDLHIIAGEFPPTPYPITPGHEFAGEIVAIGSRLGPRRRAWKKGPWSPSTRPCFAATVGRAGPAGATCAKTGLR